MISDFKTIEAKDISKNKKEYAENSDDYVIRHEVLHTLMMQRQRSLRI